MATAKITLWGMFHYLQLQEDDLFTNLNLPPDMDVGTFVGVVMQKGAEFEILYPDADWFKNFIGVWSDKYYAMFERQLRALAIEYDPLENYDRKEEWSDLRQSNDKQKNNSSSMSSSISDREDEQKVSAYDSSSYSPKEQNTGKNKINASDVGVNDSEHQGNESGLRTGRTHGNIGVTTSQAMLQAEWEVAKLNIYEEAADLFLNEFCIYVY